MAEPEGWGILRQHFWGIVIQHLQQWPDELIGASGPYST